jgi:hypothetical protein
MIISNVADCASTVGVELECFVIDGSNGEPMDVKTALHEQGNVFNVLKSGVIKPEVGPHQVEFITNPEFRGLLLYGPLERLTKAFLSDIMPGTELLYRSFWEPKFADFDALLAHPATSPQHAVKLRALALEAGHERVALWSIICSTHVHVGVVDARTWSQYPLYNKRNLWAGLLLRNFLTLCAPYMARNLTPEGEQEELSRRFEVIMNSIAPARAPRYTWLADEEALLEYVRSMGPRLYRQDPCTGEWVVDLVTPSNFNDPVVRDCVFDLVRLSNKGTVELRVLPPMSDPFLIAKAAETVQHICMRVLDHCHVPRAYRIEDVASLFGELHQDFPLYVPPLPLSEEDWYTLLRG